jgi:hypothetical protein
MDKFKLLISRANFIFLGILAFAAVLLIAFGPLVPDDRQLKECVVNIHLPVGGLSMNCDSPEFLRLATDPKFLFEPRNDRQSRPGYIVAAWLVARPFSPLMALADKIGFKAMRETPPRFTRPLTDYFPAYIAYVLLDVFFIWLSARLFWALFAGADKKISWAVFVFSLIFVFNGIVYYYFLSPHTQVFNLFVPIFCLWAAFRAYQGDLFLRKNIFLLSFLAGLGILAYTTFSLFFPAVILGEFFRQKKISRLFLFRYSAVLGLMLLPLALWYLMVILKNGEFFNVEIDYYNYGIWNQAVGFSGLALLFFRGVREMAINILSKNLYIFLAGAASMFFLWKKFVGDRPLFFFSAFFSLSYVVFFAALTFYPDRVLLAVALPWLVPLVVFVERKLKGRPAFAAAVVYILGWIAWMLFAGLGNR